MFRYDEFILESQLDLISESILYFSPKLRKLFKKLSNKEGATGEIIVNNQITHIILLNNKALLTSQIP